MKNTKWVPFSMSAYQYKGVEQWLNRQAEQGWELVSLGVVVGAAKFRRTERTDLRYCVDLFSGRREDQLEYLALCREAGWEPVARSGMMAVFASRPGTDPDPIQTDPALERANYRKAYLRAAVRGLVPLGILLVFYGILAAAGGGTGAMSSRLSAMWTAGWLTDWGWADIKLLLPLLGVAAVWWSASFIGAQVANHRAGRVTAPPAWVLWVNCGVNLLVLLSILAAGAGLAAGLFQGSISTSSLVGSFIGAAIGLLIRAGETGDGELYPGERRRTFLVCGVMAALAVAVFMASVMTAGTRNRDTFFARANDDYSQHQAMLDSLPIVQEEDLGLEPALWHKFIQGSGPVGEYTLYYTDLNYQLAGFSCARYECRTEWLAKWTAGALCAEAEGAVVNSFDGAILFTGARMTRTVLNAGDEAWYGEGPGPYSPNGGGAGQIAVLVVRKGNVVVRVSGYVEMYLPGQFQSILDSIKF